MLSRNQRQAAIRAAIAKKENYTEPLKDFSDSCSIVSSRSVTSLRASRLRRERAQTQSQTRAVIQKDDRDDTGDNRLRRGGKHRSKSQERSTCTGSRCEDTIDTSSGRFRTDKRQKKVVYTSFSDNPYAVLEIRVEEHYPTPRDKKDVVLKVIVSAMDKIVIISLI